MRGGTHGAVAAALALAAAIAAEPARAYVRTSDARTGEALFWPLPVVTWHLNPDWPDTSPTCQATAAGDPALEAARASFAQWEQGCADLRLVYAGPLAELRTGSGGSEENLVVFRRGWCSQNPAALADPSRCMDDPDVDCGGIYGCYEDSAMCIGRNSCADWGVVALTSVIYDPATGRIVDADIELNGWDGVVPTPSTLGIPPQHGWYFTCVPGTQAAACTTYGQGGCAYMDLQNTLTHEIGHFVGLAHPCGESGQPSCSTPLPATEVPYNQRTMAPSTAPGDVIKRSVSADDVAGVCAIYPQPSGGCGCGGGEAGAASLLVAALALRPLRRRRAR